MSKKQQSNKGFTLFTFIIVFGVVALLGAAVFMVVNPAKRLGQSYDARRWADVTAIAKAVELYNLENQGMPSDFSTSTLSANHKFVLCSSEGALACGGETLGCLVVDDSDFVGKYLPSLPVDPLKSDASDTGYYITRKGDNMLVVGACDSYNNDTIQFVAKASLPEYTPICGDSVIEGNEVCDDGNTTTETSYCGNGILENDTHCNATCTSEYTLNEVCDHNWSYVCTHDEDNDDYYQRAVYGAGCGKNDTLCNENCDACIFQCLGAMP